MFKKISIAMLIFVCFLVSNVNASYSPPWWNKDKESSKLFKYYGIKEAYYIEEEINDRMTQVTVQRGDTFEDIQYIYVFKGWCLYVNFNKAGYVTEFNTYGKNNYKKIQYKPTPIEKIKNTRSPLFHVKAGKLLRITATGIPQGSMRNEFDVDLILGMRYDDVPDIMPYLY